jgi:hypothetical protein
MKAIFLLMWLALPFLLFAQQGEDPLASHHWQDRVIVIFTPNDGEAAFQEQLARLEEGSEAFRERDLIVYKVIGEGGVGPGDTYLDKQQSRLLRKHLGMSLGLFSVFLIGKDGGVKLRSEQPVAAPRLFVLIDSMPMRKREMREQRP